MAIRTELTLRLPNSPGALAGVCRALAEERVRVTAMALDGAGQLRLLLDNPVRAAGVLRERRHTVGEREVLVVQVSSAPAALPSVLAMLGEAGVNVEYAYGATPDAGQMTVAVLAVEDAVRAAAAVGA